MPMINVLKEFLATKGVETAYQFHKKTGLPQATAYRLYNKRNVYPDQKTQEIVCKVFDAQPGDFLRYEPDNAEASGKLNSQEQSSNVSQLNSAPFSSADDESLSLITEAA
ncbi:helix-turn-helix transcriptional regulator [Nostoc punctiforme FACHB-252]|uniref:Helix-turn-helix transcriptional regulator n=2 Tax=Nostoc punctiforme TaxID=272131 RepID=A0ABR8HNB4_NOSPU|nr:helix-turn-helix transcriptional regulator [Nostoc punctiforme FACHB-252]